MLLRPVYTFRLHLAKSRIIIEMMMRGALDDDHSNEPTVGPHHPFVL